MEILGTYQTETDSAGLFRFTALADGQYTLRASTVGYRRVQRDFEVVQGRGVEFDLVLSPYYAPRTDTVEVVTDPFDLSARLSATEFVLAGGDAKNLSTVLIDDPMRPSYGAAVGDRRHVRL